MTLVHTISTAFQIIIFMSFKGRTPANLGNEKVKAIIQVRLDAEYAAWEEREARLRAEEKARREAEENARQEVVKSRYAEAINVVVTGSVTPKVNGVYVPKGIEHESGDWPVYHKENDPEMLLVYKNPEWLGQTAADRAVDEQSILDIQKYDEGTEEVKGRRPARICRAFVKFVLDPPRAPEHHAESLDEVTEFKKWMGAFFKCSTPCTVQIRAEKDLEGSEELEQLRRVSTGESTKRGSIQLHQTNSAETDVTS